MPSLNRTTRVEELRASFPHLETRLDFLLDAFGEPTQKPYGSYFVYGQPGTGKTGLLTALLTRLSLPHVFVNLVDCFSAQVLFESILDGLSGVRPRPSNGFAKFATCSTLHDFNSLFLKAREKAGIQPRVTVYVVLDRAEMLREMPHYILSYFLRMQEMTKSNVCVVLISQLLWEKFHQNTGTSTPICVHFPALSRVQLVDVLALEKPPGYEDAFFRNFVQLVLSVFYTKCRDLRELQYLCRTHFPKYIEPVTKGEATLEDGQKLWRQIQPVLRDAIQALYLREVSSSQWDLQTLATQKSVEEESQLKAQLLPSSNASSSSSSTAPSKASTTSVYSRSRINVELPFFSKFLLIASYIASYNPASTDRRFFCKNPGKLRKTLKLMKKSKEKRHQTTTQILGPKAFPMDRLMAIFYSIVDERVPPSAFVLSQLTSLVTLKFIANAGQGDNIDAKKFKCCVSLEFVQSVAKTVHFDINQYLYDLL